MKAQLLLSCFVASCLLFSCEKKISDTDIPAEIEGASANGSNKMQVCHRQGNGGWHLINISSQAWSSHQQHGDVRLDDNDGDGYVPANACNYGNAGDCDDNNPQINPAQTEICGNGIDDNCNGIIDENCAVQICNQTWMIKNLDVSTYRNGDPIPQVTDNVQWVSLTTGAWCWYNNDSATYAATYGKLYNWYAVMDPRGLAPAGWHVPTAAEWDELTNCLGGSGIAGGALKEAGLSHWISPNAGATNSSGFTGLPAGFRYSTDGKFWGVGWETYWWSVTPCCPSAAWVSYLSFNVPNHIRTNGPETIGISVRCIKD